MDIVCFTANLGHLKAYRVVKTPNRGLKLDLFKDLAFPEARGPYPNQVTDSAGRFPVTQHAGPATALAAHETLTLELENHRRLVRLVAETITTTLEEEPCDGWYFSARPEIFYAILNSLPPQHRDTLLRSAHADLTKTAPGQILPFFEMP